MNRCWGLLLIVSFAFAASWAVAGNGRVEIVRLTLTDQMEEVANCGDYFVLENFDAKLTLKFHYGKDGTLVKEMDNFRMIGHSTFYNSEYPDIALRGGPEGIIIKAAFVDDEVTKLTMSGLNYKVTLPGVGMVFHQGGHYVFDFATGMWTQVGGPDDFFSGDTDALCEALAP